jgi:hypothetical protein
MFMDTIEEGTFELGVALAASVQRRALYEIGGRRAFVSERHQKFDFGVQSQVGRVTKFNQTSEVLNAILSKHAVPVDTGWKPQ